MCEDQIAELRLHSVYLLDRNGTLRVRHTVTNTGADDFELTELAVVLPLPPVAQEIADFTGKWAGERAEQRLPVNLGSWTRENRRGRTAADSALRDHGRHAGVPAPGRPGLGGAPGLERRQRELGGGAARRHQGAGCRRTPGARRDHPRTGRELCHAVGVRRLFGGRDRRHQPPVPPHHPRPRLAPTLAPRRWC